jgi:hypothetical protein
MCVCVFADSDGFNCTMSLDSDQGGNEAADDGMLRTIDSDEDEPSDSNDMLKTIDSDED